MDYPISKRSNSPNLDSGFGRKKGPKPIAVDHDYAVLVTRPDEIGCHHREQSYWLSFQRTPSEAIFVFQPEDLGCHDLQYTIKTLGEKKAVTENGTALAF